VPPWSGIRHLIFLLLQRAHACMYDSFPDILGAAPTQYSGEEWCAVCGGVIE